MSFHGRRGSTRSTKTRIWPYRDDIPMPNDDERPVSRYGMQTWSGMAREATGFAGMLIGEVLAPGLLYGV